MIDAKKPDVSAASDCPDAASTLIYLVSGGGELWSFYPPTLTFKMIGTLACPNAGSSAANSMAVDRKGTAYVVYTNGNLYEVSTVTAACSSTSFKPVPMSGFEWFGMGFAGDDKNEQLYAAGQVYDPSVGLATIDTTTFNFTFLGEFDPPIDAPELTGTGDGRLFGWSPHRDGNGSTLVEIDRKTAKILGANSLASSHASGFAVAFWGGDFYIFHGDPQIVTKYDLLTQTESTLTTTPDAISGAGVSTCAPTQ